MGLANRIWSDGVLYIVAVLELLQDVGECWYHSNRLRTRVPNRRSAA